MRLTPTGTVFAGRADSALTSLKEVFVFSPFFLPSFTLLWQTLGGTLRGGLS
jgi:hypothetical protein